MSAGRAAGVVCRGCNRGKQVRDMYSTGSCFWADTETRSHFTAGETTSWFPALEAVHHRRSVWRRPQGRHPDAWWTTPGL